MKNTAKQLIVLILVVAGVLFVSRHIRDRVSRGLAEKIEHDLTQARYREEMRIEEMRISESNLFGPTLYIPTK